MVTVLPEILSLHVHCSTIALPPGQLVDDLKLLTIELALAVWLLLCELVLLELRISIVLFAAMRFRFIPADSTDRGPSNSKFKTCNENFMKAVMNKKES